MSKNHPVQSSQRKAHQKQALLTTLKDVKQENIVKTLYDELGQGLAEVELDLDLFRKMITAITGKKKFNPDTIREFLCKINEDREAETRKQVRTNQKLEDLERWRSITEGAYIQIQLWFKNTKYVKKTFPCAMNSLTKRDFEKLRSLTDSVKHYCSAYFPQTDSTDIQECFDRVYDIILQASKPAGTKKLPNINAIWHIFRQANIIYAIVYSSAKNDLDINVLRDLINKEGGKIKRSKKKLKLPSTNVAKEYSFPLPMTKWAEIFKVSENTLRKLRKEKKYHFHQISKRKWRLPKHEIPTEYLEKYRQTLSKRTQ